MDGISINMSWENVRINIKDVLQIVSFVVVAAFFFSAQSSKIEALADTMKEIKADKKEADTESKLTIQTIFNQVQSNSMQLKLLEQRVNSLEPKSKN